MRRRVVERRRRRGIRRAHEDVAPGRRSTRSRRRERVTPAAASADPSGETGLLGRGAMCGNVVRADHIGVARDHICALDREREAVRTARVVGRTMGAEY